MEERNLMIPDEIPEYALDTKMAAQMNEDALAGISFGFPPSIRTKSGKFRLVDSSGVEKVLKPGELTEGEYLATVILRARKPYEKVFYASAFDPNQTENKAPDCFSNDGEKPDASVAEPQSKVCANCPQNAFGSGRNDAGNPTKGKACKDLKVTAAFCKGGIYRFAVNPASLKNWGGYVKQLTSRGIPLGNVITLLGFDDNDANIMTFHFGGFLKPEQITQMSEKAQSDEADEIVSTSNAPVPAPQAKPEPAPAEASTDDLGLDEPTAQEPEEKPAPKPKAKPKAKKEDPEPKDETPSDAPSDDELADALGL